MASPAETWSNLSLNARRGIVGGVVVLITAIAVVAALAGGGGSDGDNASKTSKPGSTTSTSLVVPTTTEPSKGPKAPLTGLRIGDSGLLYRAALAVKIDNLDTAGESAVPQTGVNLADVVFEEIVEGNITRFVAIYHSRSPGTVGPVRSARTSDLGIIPQLGGKTLFSWSGANGGVAAAVRASPSIVDRGHDALPGAYHRDRSRRAPHNLYLDTDAVWKSAPEGLRFPLNMFRFRAAGQKNPAGAPKAQGVDINWGARSVAPVSWRWDPKARVYVRFQRNRPHKVVDGSLITRNNVIIMTVDYTKDGGGSPVAETVGKGEVFVYTNGREIQGTWDRQYPGFPPALRDTAGNPILLSPGQTWVELTGPNMAKTIEG